jgi:hypothetical protein
MVKVETDIPVEIFFLTGLTSRLISTPWLRVVAAFWVFRIKPVA